MSVTYFSFLEKLEHLDIRVFYCELGTDFFKLSPKEIRNFFLFYLH